MEAAKNIDIEEKRVAFQVEANPDLITFLGRHAHIVQAGALVLKAEVKRNGRCPFYIAAARVFRLPTLSKRFKADKVSERRVKYVLTTAHQMGAFQGLGLKWQPGAGMVPDWEGQADSVQDRATRAFAEAKGKERAREEFLAELAKVEHAAYAEELAKLRRVAGL